jgi:predicted nucleic-acid-binding protein
MIAIDTNVVVRLLVNDDAAQARRARKLVQAGEVLVPLTVLLETEWVLRYTYGLGPAEIVGLLRGLLGLPGVTSEDPPRLARALHGFERGIDFADALHIASSGEAASFATFDTKLQRRARGIDAPSVVAA